jgi:hypothetical protein
VADGPVALVGDIAFLHDLNAPVARGCGLSATIVLVNNDGGGIFSFLPSPAGSRRTGSGLPEHYESCSAPAGSTSADRLLGGVARDGRIGLGSAITDRPAGRAGAEL